MNIPDRYDPEFASGPPARRKSSSPHRDSGRGESSPPPFNLRVLARAFTRHWWQILTLWVLGSAALTIAVFARVKPSYEASSQLRVEPAHDGVFGSGATDDMFEPYLRTQVQLILSTKVLSMAMEDPTVAGLPTIQAIHGSDAVLKKFLSVQILPGTYLIEVSMRSPSPNEAAAIVNAVVGNYLDLANEWSHGATQEQIKNLETYSEELRAEAEEKEKELLELAKKGDIDPLSTAAGGGAGGASRTTMHSITLEEYKKYEDLLLKTRADLIAAESVLEARREKAAMPTAANKLRAQAHQDALVDPDVVALEQQVRTVLNKLTFAKRAVRNVSDPSFTRLQQKLDDLRVQQRRLIADKERSILTRLGEGGGESGMSLSEAEEEVATLRNSVERLTGLISELDVKNREEGGNSARMSFIHNSLESIRGFQMATRRKLDDMRFQIKGVPRISRHSPAKAPTQAAKDSRVKALAVAPIGLIVMLFALFVVVEVRADRIGDPDELSSRGRVEILGVVPPLPGPQPSRGRAALEYSNRVQELEQSLEHLRVAIHHAARESPGHCVMITSATGGEGKTNLAVQLAARCARSGESTLLIDADLRRTVLGQLLDLERGPGLSDVLVGDASLSQVLVEGLAGGFHLLPAGTLGKDPSALFSGRAFEQLLIALRRSYDLILIDTPPVLPVPDALTLGRACDGAVLAVRHDNSRFPLVERAKRRLSGSGVAVLGAVITGLRPSKTNYGTYVYGRREGYTRG
jgi:capsular exopolysaccharide synthesis family protein